MITRILMSGHSDLQGRAFGTGSAPRCTSNTELQRSTRSAATSSPRRQIASRISSTLAPTTASTLTSTAAPMTKPISSFDGGWPHQRKLDSLRVGGGRMLWQREHPVLPVPPDVSSCLRLASLESTKLRFISPPDEINREVSENV